MVDAEEKVKPEGDAPALTVGDVHDEEEVLVFHTIQEESRCVGDHVENYYSKQTFGWFLEKIPWLRQSPNNQGFVRASHSPEYAAISDEKIEERDDAGAEKPGPVNVVVHVGGIQS